MADHTHEPVSNHHYIPDLQALLRTKMGDDLILENYTATDLLAVGENYGSLILKVDAVIRRREKDSKSEELHMVAKTPPLSKLQRFLFGSDNSFKKEAFMYDTILPTYKKIERESGINEKDIFDVGPAFYGSRCNLQFGDVFDDNAVILLENLKVRGYYSGSRFNGLDIHHSRVVVKAIARFHALGIAVKTKNPDLFEVMKTASKNIFPNHLAGNSELAEVMHRSIQEDPVMSQHYDLYMKALEVIKAGMYPKDAEETWSTIIHDDFWINNILFHRNKGNGLLDDVKFVDFQNYLFRSPLRELSFLISTLVDHEVSTKYVPELIDLYYKTFVSRLEMMVCDVSPFSRDQFDQQLPKDALLEFKHIAYMLKISTKAVDPNDAEPTNIVKCLLGGGSVHYYARMRDLVTGYAQRGWFQKILEMGS